MVGLAQVYGQNVGKGLRVYEPTALLPTWLAHLDTVKYDTEVLKLIPDLRFPMIQTCISGTERVYTVDGFIDETGEMFTAQGCVKVLQRLVALVQGLFLKRPSWIRTSRMDCGGCFRGPAFSASSTRNLWSSAAADCLLI
jgi:hypothetical protein